jgi:hypothetical protein
MNRDDDFIAQLEDYLDTYEGVVPLPASVRDAVQARLPATRQVRGAHGPERVLDMTSRLSSSPARWLAGIAAVLVIVIGVAALFTRSSTPGIGAASTAAPASSSLPPPTGSPSAAASVTATLLTAAPQDAPCGEGLGDICMPAGTYQLPPANWPATISFDVPEGWWPYIPTHEYLGVLVESGPTAPGGSGWGVMFLAVGEVSKDPCDPAAGRFPAANTATVDGLVAAMRTWPGFHVSAAQPIEIDGRAGQAVEVTSTHSTADCTQSVIWHTPMGTALDAYPMVSQAEGGEPAEFRIVQVDDQVVVVRSSPTGSASPHELSQGVAPDPDRHAADLPEQQSIIDSIRFES